MSDGWDSSTMIARFKSRKNRIYHLVYWRFQQPLLTKALNSPTTKLKNLEVRMKNFLRVTIVLLLLAATGSTATLKQSSAFGGPAPICTPDGACLPN